MNRRDKKPPIKLEWEDAIYYGIVATYMNKKRKIVKVDADAAKIMLNHVSNEILEGATDDNGKVEVEVCLSDSAYTNVQSEIAFIFRQCGIKRPDEITDRISIYCKGSKRRGKKFKQELVLDLSVGKKPMILEVFEFLSKQLFVSRSKESIFAHLFWCLTGKFSKIYFIYFYLHY